MGGENVVFIESMLTSIPVRALSKAVRRHERLSKASANEKTRQINEN